MAVHDDTRRRSRTASALLLTVAVVAVAAPPVLLAQLVGWPLPSWPIDMAAAVEAVQIGLVPSMVWVNALAVIAWVAWAVLVGMLLVEIVAVAADRPSARAAPGWLRQVAQVLVTAALTLSSPAQTALSGAATVVPAVVVSVDPTPAAAGQTDEAGPLDPAPDGTRLVTVVDGDSWAGLAETVMGDASLGGQLRGLNVGRQVDSQTLSADTAFVEAGWTLLVPTASLVDDRPTGATTRPGTTSNVRADANPAGDDNHEVAGDEVDAEAESWTVEPGDHMWKIAEQTLVEAWDRGVSDNEIAPYWQSVIEANEDNLLPPEDPDLIYPGQILDVPPVGPDVADADAAAERDGARSVEKPSVEQADPASATNTGDGKREVVESQSPAAQGSPGAGTRTDRQADRSDSLDAGAQLGDVADSESSAPPSAVGAPVRPGANDISVDQVDDGQRGSDSGIERTVWGSPGGLAGSVAAVSFAAAGIAALLRRRRRTAVRQRPVGLRLPTPAPEGSDELDRLTARAADPRALETLAVLLETVPPANPPPLVTTDDDGTVQLLWDGTQVPKSLPNPWEPLLDDDSVAGWQARLGDEGAPASTGIPLLATLGRTDAGLTVLANIGAMRQLAVTGQPAQVRTWLRVAALEVATSNLDGIVNVAVAGDDLLTLEDLETFESFDQIVEDITAELDRDIIPADRTPRLLVAHNSEVAVDLLKDPHGLTGQLAATDERTGWVFRVRDDQATLQLPDGAELCVAMPDVNPQLVVDELDRLDNAVSVGPDIGSATEGHPAGSGRETRDTDVEKLPVSRPNDAKRDTPEDGGEVVVSMPIAPKSAWCEVQLLGPVGATAKGQKVSLSPQSKQLLVCLATSPNGLTVAQLEDRVWAGQASASGSRRVRQALHRLRTQLGDGPDGQPLLPRRTDGSSSRVRLSHHVGTDWDRATAHLEAARDATPTAAIRHLTAALELIRGPVLDGFTVDWGTRLEQEILAALQDAAVAASATLRAHEDLDRADWAVRQGLTLAVYEPLYVEWAAIEKARGRVDQVRRIFKSLETNLAADAGDTNLPVGPTAATQLAFQDLMDTTTTVEVDH